MPSQDEIAAGHKPLLTGSVEVFGRNPVSDPVEVLGRIGYLSEDRNLPAWMRIGQFMSYSQAFYTGWDPAFAEELREKFELDADQRVHSLSRGQRARVGLLVALAHRPDLLLLDEPSSGLDPIVRRDILGAIIRTVADEGRAVVFSSHLLEEVERVADRVMMLHRGRRVLCSNVDEVLESHLVITIRFRDPQRSVPRLSGAVAWSGEGREWSCLCNGELAALKRAVAELGAQLIDQRRPSLEEVFVGRAAGGSL